MHASKKPSLKSLLSPLAMVLVLAAPCAFAKKDLFANDPAGSQSSLTQNLTSTTSSSTSSPDVSREESIIPAPTEEANTDSASDEKKPSYIETQLSRLKGHLIDVKEDLFGGKKSSKKITPDTKPATEQSLVENTSVNEDVQPELPTISTAEAAQRAQTFAEGQVMNVRKYQEEEKPRYAVKLLQKNGRMKTINLNAVSGELIEETTE
jgi:uncharacterized membrane protein YkoI